MGFPRELKTNIYSVGAIDWDRRMFDELIPLPDGTSYNSYLVKGSEKTALIDAVDPSMSDVLINNLNELQVKNIDYIIVNHAEQDHSGTVPRIMEIYPDASVVATPKCKNLLKELLLIPEEKIITVEDGETISLGDKSLKFIHAPWVHWPETMFTYIEEDRTLFSCDFFGSHIATGDLFVEDESSIYEPIKRYFAEIMMPFRSNVKKDLEKIKDLDIDIIAPSHGPAYNNPEFIINAYKEWSSDEVKNLVIIPYISMHDSTKKMAEYLVDALIKRNIPVKLINLSNADVGKLAMDLVDAATLVVGSPTVLVGPHPNVVSAVYLANALRPKVKFASIIGSYGWGSKMVENLTGMMTNMKVELIDPVVVKGFPKEGDFKSLDKLADEIVKKHKEHNII
jgi:flavorubredoxin